MSNQDAYQPQPYAYEQQKKSTCGCWVVGCLGVIALGIVGVVGLGFASYWFVTGQVQKYTSDTPADIPVVEYEEEKLNELRQRIESFKSSVQTDQTADGGPPAAAESQTGPAESPREDRAATADPSASGEAQPAGGTADAGPRELVLTAEEINALIAAEESLRGRVFVTIEDGELKGDVSIPTDMIPGGGGRFLNASATFDVSMEDGVLIVRMTAAEVNGEPLPRQVMDELSKQNLARDVYDDPDIARALRQFESVRVEDDKVVLRLREPSDGQNTDGPAAGTKAEPADAKAEPADAKAEPADAKAEPSNSQPDSSDSQPEPSESQPESSATVPEPAESQPEPADIPPESSDGQAA